MVEIILSIAAVGAVAEIARFEEQSRTKWAVITAGVCILCILLVPLPVIRIGIAMVAAVTLLMFVKN